jgi:hypothetical protein
MAAPDLARAALLLRRCLSAVQEDAGLTTEMIVKRIGPVNYAEIIDFYQNVRRRHILAQGGESFEEVIARELQLWDSRVAPHVYVTNPRKSPSKARHPRVIAM